MKICEEYASLLDPFVDGELTGDEARRVREHLVSCASCAAYVADAMAIRAGFGDIEETQVPEGLADGVMAVIRAHAAPQKRNLRQLKAVASLAACAVIVFAAIQVIPFGGFSSASSPMAAATADDGAALKTNDGGSEAGSESSLFEDRSQMNAQLSIAGGETSSPPQDFDAQDFSESGNTQTAGNQELSSALFSPSEPEMRANEDSWTENGSVVFAGVVRLSRTQQLTDLLSGRESKPYLNAQGDTVGTGYAMTLDELKPILDEMGLDAEPTLNRDRTTELYCLVVTEP